LKFRADALDSGVRGRFAREFALPVPDTSARIEILKLLTQNMKINQDIDYSELGKLTPGYVGADLIALVRDAGVQAVTRIVNEFSIPLSMPKEANNLNREALDITMNDTVCKILSLLTGQVDCTKSDETNQISVSTKSNGTHELQINESSCSLSVDNTEKPTSLIDDGSGGLTDNINGWNDDIPSKLSITMADFLVAAKNIQPSAKREGFAVVPDVTWNDVGALVEVREELLHNVLDPIANPERFRKLGLDVPAGVLFFGPPGYVVYCRLFLIIFVNSILCCLFRCGKTLLAKAVANQSGANFISVKGPELLNMFVGESESRVRQVFQRAKSSAPCVIFFDELDALCPKRGSGFDGGGNGVSERVVNQLLTELDGVESRKDVYIIGATNRLELIDDAMLRPGRLGKLLYVPLPSKLDRVSILRALLRKVNTDTSDEGKVDPEVIAGDDRAEGFSGADIAALVREAGLAVIREWRSRKDLSIDNSSSVTVEECGTFISKRHFENAFQYVQPSVSYHDRMRYEKVNILMKQGMGALQALKVVEVDMITHSK
jgi:ribosome biogenesis ATPase